MPEIRKIVSELDPSFFKMEEYVPSNEEISRFLSVHKESVLDAYGDFIYNGIVNETFLYRDKLITPRISLLLNNEIRMKELLKLYYDMEDGKMSDNNLTSFLKEKKKVPLFSEFTDGSDMCDEKSIPLEQSPELNFIRYLHKLDGKKLDDIDEDKVEDYIEELLLEE